MSFAGSPVPLFVGASWSLPTGTVGPGTGSPVSRAVLSRHKVVTRPRLATSSEDRLQARSLEQDPCPQSLIRGQRGRTGRRPTVQGRSWSASMQAQQQAFSRRFSLISLQSPREPGHPHAAGQRQAERGQGPACLHGSEPGIKLLCLLGSGSCLSCSRRDRGWPYPALQAGAMASLQTA